jgi:predicted aspartyl protease
MRIDGRWLVCEDGIVRPVLRGETRAADGSWVKTELLVDTGADRTVLSAAILERLGIPPPASAQELGGVGGQVVSVVIETAIKFQVAGGGSADFNGRFAALTDPESLDMSVLGRDILGLFAVIVDRPQDVVCMLGQRHGYAVVEQ